MLPGSRIGKFSISRGETLLWFFAALVLLLFLAQGVLSAGEGRDAEIVRELMVSEKWFETTLNYQPADAQPVWWYHLALPFAYIFGLDEFSLRLVAVVFSLLGLWGSMRLARRWFGDVAALMTGWLMLGMSGFILSGRQYGVDAALSAVSVWTVFGLLTALERPFYRNWFVFFLAAAAGSLWFLWWYVPALILLLSGIWFGCGNWKCFFRRECCGAFFSVLALVICGACWYHFYVKTLSLSVIFSGAENCLSLWTNATECWSYLLGCGKKLAGLFNLLFPWTLLVLWCVPELFCNRDKLPAEFKWLLTGAGLLWLFNVLMPAYGFNGNIILLPVAAIAVSAVLTMEIEPPAGRVKLLAFFRLLLTWAASLAFAFPFILPLRRLWSFPALPFWAVAALVMAAALVLLLLIFDTGKGNSVSTACGLPEQLGAMLIGTAILFGVVFSCFIPVCSRVFHPEYDFFDGLREKLSVLNCNNIIYLRSRPDWRIWFYADFPREIHREKNSEPGMVEGFLDKKRSENAVIISDNAPERIVKLLKLSAKLQLDLHEQNAVLKEEPPIFSWKNNRQHLVWIFEVPDDGKGIK